VHTPEEDKGFDVFIEHDDVLPQFNYAMNDNDTTEENKHKPRPLSFGRIDHKNKMFYIISQAKGQPEGKEQYGRPDYTLMRKKDVENDVYNRLHTARAVHEKHPGYRIEVSGHPNHMVLSLPEYEKFLMSQMDTELKESAIEPKVDPPDQWPTAFDPNSGQWSDPMQSPNDSYDQTQPYIPPSIVDIWYAIPEWMRDNIPPNHIPWVTKELWKILEFYYGPPQNWDPILGWNPWQNVPSGMNPWHTPFWMTPAFRGAVKELWGRYQRWRQGPKPQPFSPLQYPESIDPEYQVTPGWWA
jgi:hypothetical protein